MIKNLFRALSTYRELKSSSLLKMSREDFEKWQSKKIDKWLRTGPSNCNAFSGLIHKGVTLDDLPIMDKAKLMSSFAAYNQPGITAEEGWKAFSGTRRVGDYHVGASTGTSGNRGLYVISDEERFAWLGAILAKALPNFWKERNRIAVILPLHTRLYDAANGFGPLKLQFFNLSDGPESWQDDLAALDPTIIIAPPKILRWLAETQGQHLAPRRVFSGAEVLDPLDIPVIEEGLGPVGQIYMATEGLLGVSCEHGTLHLCEDIMHFELEPVGDSGLVSPIISDFRRTAQGMVRYRMNDLLKMKEDLCPCGRPHRAVEHIYGREDDLFIMGQGRQVQITPDVLRNAVVDADRSISDYRIMQVGPQDILLCLEPHLTAEAVDAARAALMSVCLSHSLPEVTVEVRIEALPLVTDRKLRRVERCWSRDSV